MEPPPPTKPRPYRGRLAPSPTGLLHLGHARTFWTAQERARVQNGTLILRNEDLDPVRSKPEFVTAMLEDLRWFGFEWEEGPDCGGKFGPYLQSERRHLYAAAFEKLRAAGYLYPCTCSRKDIQSAAAAPHAGDDELIYPGTCRSNRTSSSVLLGFQTAGPSTLLANPLRPDLPPRPATKERGEGHLSSLVPSGASTNQSFSWRFLVPEGETISFIDGRLGPQVFVAGRDFGDFVVWRPDGVPAYQLAVVVDDAAMEITEVVRGADLLVSTARQLLLYRALALPAPAFYHCLLMTDDQGIRLAKRHDALSLRVLRERGAIPATLRQDWGS